MRRLKPEELICVRSYPPIDESIFKSVSSGWSPGVSLSVRRELLRDELDQKYKYREHTHPEALRISAEIKRLSLALHSVCPSPDDRTVEQALLQYSDAAAHLRDIRPPGWMYYAGLI